LFSQTPSAQEEEAFRAVSSGRAKSRHAGSRSSAITNDDGSFDIDATSPSTFLVVARKEGVGTGAVEARFVDWDSRDRVEIVLQGDGVLAGTLIDQFGQPAAGRRLIGLHDTVPLDVPADSVDDTILRSARLAHARERSSGQLIFEVVADSNGCFAATGLSAGVFCVFADLAARPSECLGQYGTDAEALTIRVVVRQDVAIPMRAVLPDGGVPDTVEIHVRRIGAAAGPVARVSVQKPDAQGRLWVALADGTRITVYANGLQGTADVDVTSASGSVPIEIPLRAPR
jgi:hypothetical protein